ncbi:MAG: SAM-dependent chlorinase/fluorinase [Kofleriaceae bacterium]
MPIITLTTDFGMRDGYVGAMKGVISRLAPEARIVDLAHDVPRHDIAHGAWVLATSSREFPPGTIHVAVVDPGVGGSRAEVIARLAGQLYVGPDNGLFAYLSAYPGPADGRAAARTSKVAPTMGPSIEEPDGAWTIATPAFRAATPSPTFHGRDVFAPAAAALARGLPAETAGPPTRLSGRLPWQPPTEGRGHVVHVDHYGNLISDLVRGAAAVRIAGRTVPVVSTFEAAPVGALLAYVGSAGTLEIAVREGRADQVLAVGRGTPVELAS